MKLPKKSLKSYFKAEFANGETIIFTHGIAAIQLAEDKVTILYNNGAETTAACNSKESAKHIYDDILKQLGVEVESLND